MTRDKCGHCCCALNTSLRLRPAPSAAIQGSFHRGQATQALGLATLQSAPN